jgi:hypothetical protein
MKFASRSLVLLAVVAGLFGQPGPARQKVALVIGNQHYRHVPQLQTPISDASAVASVLHDQYGFLQSKLLLDATRSQIMTALSSYRNSLTPDTDLLIYYAGHGYRDRATGKAYWWPVDAEPDNFSEWISADELTTFVRGVHARHVLIVSDSCFSGTLATRGVDIPVRKELQSNREIALRRIQQRPSRELLASGGDEPVADGGGGEHSIFAAALLRGLKEMDASAFPVDELFQQVRVAVAGQSAQVPKLDFIRDSGHDEGGSFIFTRDRIYLHPPPPSLSLGPSRSSQGLPAAVESTAVLNSGPPIAWARLPDGGPVGGHFVVITNPAEALRRKRPNFLILSPEGKVAVTKDVAQGFKGVTYVNVRLEGTKLIVSRSDGFSEILVGPLFLHDERSHTADLYRQFGVLNRGSLLLPNGDEIVLLDEPSAREKSKLPLIRVGRDGSIQWGLAEWGIQGIQMADGVLICATSGGGQLQVDAATGKILRRLP